MGPWQLGRPTDDLSAFAGRLLATAAAQPWDSQANQSSGRVGRGVGGQAVRSRARSRT